MKNFPHSGSGSLPLLRVINMFLSSKIAYKLMDRLMTQLGGFGQNFLTVAT